jgi:diguanylate cyclase (GGDEF)-like protein
VAATNLRLYSFLSRWSPISGFRGKVMLVAFLGTHVPLLALLCYFLIWASLSVEITVVVLLVALAATLSGTALTLYVLHHLLAPVTQASLSLRRYVDTNVLPMLPTHFSDEVGLLMAGTQHTITKLDEVIRHLESYDALTALPNRTLFADRLQQAVAQSRRAGRPVAVLRIDLEEFGQINAALPSGTGDAILKQVARRLSGIVRETDTLARLDGAAFALVQIDVGSVAQIETQARRILAAFTDPFAVDRQTVFVNASIGIAVFPTDATGGEELLRNAGAAVYSARNQGRNTYQFFAADLNTRLHDRLALEHDLRHALDRGEILLHYQPQIDVQSGQMTGVEALLRWQHPQRGFVSPAEFVPIAEASGLIVPIGEWVLRSACAQNQAWQAAGLPPLKMAVNLSARQFQQHNMVEMVRRVLDETGHDPALLELEVTESAVMDDLDRTIAMLEQLRGMGIAIALDDFGTGYSSLNYLQTLPIDTVKIDRSFMRDVTSNTDNAAIANAIITLAHRLRLDVLAEGVETAAQVDYLKTQSCDQLQGYFFSRPVPAEQLALLLHEQSNAQQPIPQSI